MGNQKNPATAENTAEKKMTKYDRKMQARKEAAEREKRQAMVARITAVAVAVLIIVIVVAVPLVRRANAKSEYIRIGNHSVSKIDYDFHYSYGVNSYLTNYSYILPYLGLDTSQSFDSQEYDENTTWQQYFDQMTVANISQYLALCDDAEKNNFSYDVTEDSDEFYSGLTEAATAQGITLKSYLKNMFGAYATKSSLKDAVTTLLTAQAYYSHLLEENKPDDTAVAERYAENKRDYDSINFSSFDMQADIPEDATDEQKTAALAAAKEKADTFVSRYQAGEDFLTLCREYATEEQKETYAADDASAAKDATYSNTHSSYRDWLFDEARTANEATVVEDSTACHIVVFHLRQKPDTVDQQISDTIASEKVRTYVDGIVEGYDLSDPDDHLNLKDIRTAEDDGDGTDGNDENNNNGSTDGNDENNGDGNGSDDSTDGGAGDGNPEGTDGAADGNN